MAKKQIREEIRRNWIVEMDGLTKEQAIKYIDDIPYGYVLDVEYDYDRVYGQLFCLREETDEEESIRESREKIEREEYIQKLEEKSNRDAANAALAEASSRALARYNRLHVDNPRVLDMCNLYKMIIDLESQGKSVDTLKECLTLLERGE